MSVYSHLIPMSHQSSGDLKQRWGWLMVCGGAGDLVQRRGYWVAGCSVDFFFLIQQIIYGVWNLFFSSLVLFTVLVFHSMWQ